MIMGGNDVSWYGSKSLKYIAGMKQGHDKCIA